MRIEACVIPPAYIGSALRALCAGVGVKVKACVIEPADVDPALMALAKEPDSAGGSHFEVNQVKDPILCRGQGGRSAAGICLPPHFPDPTLNLKPQTSSLNTLQLQ